MNYYTILELMTKGIPSRDYISNMFYDWFCKDEALGRRGEICLKRLRSLVSKYHYKFLPNDKIDLKNCCKCCGGVYDCIRVWSDSGDFKYAFVPQEEKGGSSVLPAGANDIIFFGSWTELKKGFGTI